jgi:hypothetical protein
MFLVFCKPDFLNLLFGMEVSLDDVEDFFLYDPGRILLHSNKSAARFKQYITSKLYLKNCMAEKK